MTYITSILNIVLALWLIREISLRRIYQSNYNNVLKALATYDKGLAEYLEEKEKENE